MDFVSIRLITHSVEGLVSFYEDVTGTAAVRHTEDFAELRMPSGTVAIASLRTVERLGPGVVQGASNRSVIIEFRVADVDQCFGRLAHRRASVVMDPTTMPWGNRSMLLRDPDGNLINLFTPPQGA